MRTRRTTRRRIVRLWLLGLLALSTVVLGGTGAGAERFSAPAAPQAITGFTYQGFLKDGGEPANGLFDFEFRLYDAETGGSQLGAVTRDDVTVTDGLFATSLDFGLTQNAAGYLELAVRYGAETGAYTTLLPRQTLGPAPWAANADLLDNLDASAFARRQYLLLVLRDGAGNGTITADSGGIACGSTCAAGYDPGAVVALSAAPDGVSAFAGWSGACSGTGTCSVTMNAAALVRARFDKVTYTATVTRTSGGTVTSSPAGLACGAACSAGFDSGSTVTLTAAPDPSASFAGWSGACNGGSTSCVLSMTAARSVTARFLYPLAVYKAGSGTGTVTSAPAGIACGTTCAQVFDGGATMTLTATPGSTSSFAGWSGACGGSTTCTVTMSDARNVTATFTRIAYTLTVVKAGAGGGTVTSNIGGINCGSTCSASYDPNTSVTLTTMPDGNSTFLGWSGSCTGTGACSVTMDAAKSVSATFTPATRTLAVTVSGAGAGAVYSIPAGISCPSTCWAGFSAATTVLLIGAPDSVSLVDSWSGCSAAGGASVACAVTMDGNKNVSVGSAPY